MLHQELAPIVVGTASSTTLNPRIQSTPSNHISALDQVSKDVAALEVENDNASNVHSSSLIIVATVDGTLAGLCKDSGRLLWKRQSKERTDVLASDHILVNRILQPLISTSTTKQSMKSRNNSQLHEWKTSAVPSIDGSVYLTAVSPTVSSEGTSTTSSSDSTSPNEVTVTTSLPDLVSRSPFVDTRGSIYSGSRHSISFALDGDSGEILQLIPGTSNTDDKVGFTSSNSNRNKNVIWLGRVDYAVSVHEPRTGNLDVKFASSHIMGVNDMIQGTAYASPVNYASQSQSPFGSALASTFFPFASIASTPNGNVALRTAHDPIAWVASETFDSPVAFAIDAVTGSSMRVDILPDATVPHGSVEYVSKEIERQINLIHQLPVDEDLSMPASEVDIVVSNQEPIIGFLSTGDLFAMPLGRPYGETLLESQTSNSGSLSSSSHLRDQPYHSTALSSSMAYTVGSKQSTHHLHPLSHSRYPFLHNHLHHHQQQQQQQQIHHQRHDHPAFRESSDPNWNALAVQYQHDQQGSWYIPPPHYYTIVKPPDKRQRRYRKVMRLLGSWLPPTVALLFVVSFELGRRKRVVVNQLRKGHSSDLTDVSMSVDGSVLATTNDIESSGVIQVMNDVILGYGGHGTVVYQGLLEGRQVAVKRMLRAYHASADREISLLIESDGHPNVVRYFLKEVRGDFVYLALELCDLSLHDLIQKLRARMEVNEKENTLSFSQVPPSTRSILFEIASGVRHLHKLRIVHRDLKPMNILLSAVRARKTKNNDDSDTCDASALRLYDSGSYTAKISDMGLGKQLVDQSSFAGSVLGGSSLRGAFSGELSSIAVAGVGSVGWQAPEVMAKRSVLRADSTSVRSDGSGGMTVPSESTAHASPTDVASNARTSRSVDIFSLGCTFYSTLIPGFHPFGEWYEREANIIHNRSAIEALEGVSHEAFKLVESMLQRSQEARPTAAQVCEHPFFWNDNRRVSFLCEVSDRIESDALNPDGSKCASWSSLAIAVEKNAAKVVGIVWSSRLDEILIGNVQRFRTYNASSVRDLLRLIRNKYHHFDELPSDFKITVTNSDGLVRYFDERFPRLLMHCFNACRDVLSSGDYLIHKYVHLTVDRALRLEARLGSSSFDQNSEITAVATELPDETVVPDAAIPPPDTGSTDALEDGELLACHEGKDSENSPLPVMETVDNVIWEGSSAAGALSCRGWSRSDEEWINGSVNIYRSKQDEVTLRRCVEDPKYRTRLCSFWEESLGTSCPMRTRGKCIFAHGPVELRVKEGKLGRWGTLVDKYGDNSNRYHSGGEDTYGSARLIERERKSELKQSRCKSHSKLKGKAAAKNKSNITRK